MPGITITQLEFAYPGASFRLRVPRLEVPEGGQFALLGPSGAGKTTLLRLMSGLLMPDAGEVNLGGRSPSQMSEAARRAFRLKEVGLVFQDFALMDYLTVEENVLLPGQFLRGSTSELASVKAVAERLDIARHWQRPAALLSQGERQRVAIARALAHRPRFLFADEPTASLDAARRGVVMDLLRDYTRDQGASLVMVTHDTELIPLFPQNARVEDFTA